MKKWLWGFSGGVILLWAAFWCLNFRIAASNTKSEHNSSMTSIGDGLPNTMQRRENINLVVLGEGPLVAALQKALVMEMTNAKIVDREPVQGIEPKYQSPVLVVNAGSPHFLWTPFFATSQFTIQAGYSSSGDTLVLEQTPVMMSNQNDATLYMYGEYKVSDRSWGLISRPGYYQNLAEYLAREIISTVKDLYRV